MTGFRFQARAVEQIDGTWTLFTVVTLESGHARHDEWPRFKTRAAALAYAHEAREEISRALGERLAGYTVRPPVLIDMKTGGQA